jgi:hypothetical protein
VPRRSLFSFQRGACRLSFVFLACLVHLETNPIYAGAS